MRRTSSLNGSQGTGVAGECSKCIQSVADSPTSRTATPPTPGRASRNSQFVELPIDILRTMQVQIAALTDRILQLEGFLAELHPKAAQVFAHLGSIPPVAKVLSPHHSHPMASCSSTVCRAGHFRDATPERVRTVRHCTTQVNTQARQQIVPVQPSAVEAFCSYTGRPINWFRSLDGGNVGNVQANHVTAASTSTKPLVTRMLASPTKQASPRAPPFVSMATTSPSGNALDNSMPLWPQPAQPLPAYSILQAGKCMHPTTAASGTPRVSSHATLASSMGPAAGLQRARSVEPIKFVRQTSPDLKDVTESVAANPADMDAEPQLSRQPTCGGEAPSGSAERSSSEPPSKLMADTGKASLQIVHVSTKEEGAAPKEVANHMPSRETGQSPDVPDLPSPRRRRFSGKAEQKIQNDGNSTLVVDRKTKEGNAPHVVLSLNNEKHTFLKKGAGTPFERRKQSPNKPDVPL